MNGTVFIIVGEDDYLRSYGLLFSFVVELGVYDFLF